MSDVKRIGLFGGTFNPIHYGHLRPAVEVFEHFGLDEIRFIASAVPPHKGREHMAESADRLEMTRLSINGFHGFAISDIENRRKDKTPSYTIDTIREFQNGSEGNEAFFFLIGIDAFVEIESWKSYKALFENVPFIVMTRPEPQPHQKTRYKKMIQNTLQKHVSDRYYFCTKRKCFRGDGGLPAPEDDYAWVGKGYQPVYMIQVSLLDISSSKIRALVKQRKSIRYLVPRQVEDYIRKKGLYL